MSFQLGHSALSGAVLLCSFILVVILPEGFEVLEDTYDHEASVELAAVCGMSIIGGFFIMFMADLIFGLHGKPANSANDSHASGTNFLVKNMLSIGFIFHAACDGVAIGAAVYAEDPNLELAIFVGIFVHKLVVGMTLCINLMKKLAWKAVLLALFLFSLACPVGAYITLGTLELSNAAPESIVPGILILVSAGTLMYIGLSHSLPEALEDRNKGHSHCHNPVQGQNNSAVENSDPEDETSIPVQNLVENTQNQVTPINWIDYVLIILAVAIPCILVNVVEDE